MVSEPTALSIPNGGQETPLYSPGPDSVSHSVLNGEQNLKDTWEVSKLPKNPRMDETSGGEKEEEQSESMNEENREGSKEKDMVEISDEEEAEVIELGSTDGETGAVDIIVNGEMDEVTEVGASEVTSISEVPAPQDEEKEKEEVSGLSGILSSLN
jgi:hypothetical protein